jgi:hypothetical protein
MINSPSNEPVRAAMRALYLALGDPDRVPLSDSEESLPDMRYNNGLHPVFELAETFGPGDAGYTRNLPRRGGHLSLPCFDESGDVVVIEITFHKGDTTFERLAYPRSPAQVHAALYKLLEESEVRD